MIETLASYQLVITWMSDCLWTGKAPLYITNTKVNSAFHPSGVGKLSTIQVWQGFRQTAFACVSWQVTLCDPIWQVTPRSSETGFP